MKHFKHTAITLLTILLFFGALTPTMKAQNTELVSLLTYFKKATRFDYEYPREKVYVHLDNNSYMEGDTIWFKAYVVRASSLKPRPLSRVLYAELLNADGKIMQRHLVYIDNNGGATGQFFLNLPIRRGYYEVRAYTREMTNWGPEACFSRVIPVFERKDNEGGEPELNIYKPEEESDLMPRHPRNFNFGRTSQRQLYFYPEGGGRVKGLSQQIAYRLVNGQGAACDDELHVFSGETEIAQSKPEHEGRGHFTLPADAENAYVQIGNKRFNLPACGEGEYTMHVKEETEDSITGVVIQRRPETKPKVLGLVVLCREKICYLDTLTLDAPSVQMELPAKAFHNGVNRIELFDATGHSLSHRLVWRERPESDVQVKVLQNKASYESFSPVALEMYLKDNEGNPVETTFSLAVRDAKGLLTGNAETDIKTDMLLSSELRGYVHHPEWYFNEDIPVQERRRALDDLLLVQGWTANKFSVMTTADTFDLKQPIEDKLTLNGYVYKDNDKMQPYPNLVLNLKMYSKGEMKSLSAQAKTDANGAFAFQSNENYKGDWVAHFITANDDGKKKWSRVALQRWFDIKPRTYNYEELQVIPPKAAAGGAVALTRVPETFQWKDTLEYVMPSTLGEAVVLKKTKYKGLQGGRYTYNGGEKAGQRKADIYYNVEQEVEILKDKGESVGTIWDLLATVDKDFDYDRSLEGADAVEEDKEYANEQRDQAFKPEWTVTPGVDNSTSDSDKGRAWLAEKIRYKNKTFGAVFLNNDTDSPLLKTTLWADEIKSVVIMHGQSKWRNFLTEIKTVNGEDAIFLYERPNYIYFKQKRGVDKRMIQGFTEPLEFSAPSYNGIDLPDESDYRRTLYWNPNVQSDETGKATAVFFSNARPGVSLSITAHGITSDGKFVDYTNE